MRSLLHYLQPADLGHPLSVEVNVELDPISRLGLTEIRLPHEDIILVDRESLVAGDEAVVPPCLWL